MSELAPDACRRILPRPFPTYQSKGLGIGVQEVVHILDEVRLTRTVVPVDPNARLALLAVKHRVEHQEELFNQIVREDIFLNFRFDRFFFAVAYRDRWVDVPVNVPVKEFLKFHAGSLIK